MILHKWQGQPEINQILIAFEIMQYLQALSANSDGYDSKTVNVRDITLSSH